MQISDQLKLNQPIFHFFCVRFRNHSYGSVTEMASLGAEEEHIRKYLNNNKVKLLLVSFTNAISARQFLPTA